MVSQRPPCDYLHSVTYCTREKVWQKVSSLEKELSVLGLGVQILSLMWLNTQNDGFVRDTDFGEF